MTEEQRQEIRIAAEDPNLSKYFQSLFADCEKEIKRLRMKNRAMKNRINAWERWEKDMLRWAEEVRLRYWFWVRCV